MPRKTAGFTLIELVMVMVIISVISITVGKIMFQGFKSFNTAQSATEVDWQGYIAISRLVNDIHDMGDPALITSMTSTQLTFSNMSSTTISYQLSGTNLLRNSIVLARGISALAFVYLDKNGAVTATATNVRYVKMTMTVTDDNITSSLSTMAGVRGVE